MSTMVGMGQRSNVLSDDEEQPVYLLTRRRGSVPPMPASSMRAPLASGVAEIDDGRSSGIGAIGERASLTREPSQASLMPESSHVRTPARREERSASGASWRYAPPRASSDDAWSGLADDDDADLRLISAAGRRQRAIRVLGALAIAGSLAGGAFVLQQPKVRREALSFVTMGHEEGASRLGRKIASIVDGLRHR